MTLSEGATVATRVRTSDKFCNGIVFGDRPVAPGEKITIAIKPTVRKWSGAFRFGFTNHNPDTIDPKLLAIPDLTRKQGYWAQTAAPVEDVSQRVKFSYWCNGNTVECTINGKPWVPKQTRNQMDFATSVDVHKPMWPIIDVYKQTTSVKISVEGT